MSRRPLNSSFGNEYRSSSQSNQPIANMRRDNDHLTNSHSGIHTNSSSLEVDFNWRRPVLPDSNLKSPRDTQPQRNMPSIQPVLDVLPSLQIDFDLLRSVLADPTIKKADNIQSHPTNYYIQQPMKTQQHSSTSGFEWQPVTNNERQQPYADDIKGDSDSDCSGKPMANNRPVIPPSLEINFDLSRSVLADPSFKHTRDSIFSAPIAVAPPIKKFLDVPKLPQRKSKPKSLPFRPEAPHSFLSSGDSFNSLPASVQSWPCLNASNSTLSSGNTFNSMHMSGSSQRPIQQYTMKQRNQAPESSNSMYQTDVRTNDIKFANTDGPMKTDISKDNCVTFPHESATEASCLKRKREDNDLAQSKLYCSICDRMVMGDMKMHQNGARHKFNTRLKEMNPDSTLETDEPAETIPTAANQSATKPVANIPTTAKSSGSIPDSSKALLPGPTPGSSDNRQPAFHCSVCDDDVLYSYAHLSSYRQNLERLQHGTLHEYGLSSLDQCITCTVCECPLTGKYILEHRSGNKHRQLLGAKRMKGHETGIFIPDLSRPYWSVKTPDTLSTVPKVGLRPAIKDSRVTTVSTRLSKDKIEPSDSTTVLEDRSQPEFIKSMGGVPQLTFYCNICKLELCGPNILEEHLLGRCHASNVCELGNKTGDCFVPPAARVSPAVLNILNPRIARMTANDPFISVKSIVDVTRFQCTLCKVQDIVGRQELDKHLRSAYHKMKLEKFKEQNDDDIEFIEEIKHAPPATPTTSRVDKPVAEIRICGFYCDTCAIYVVDCEQSRKHLNSKAHKKMVAAMASESAGAVIPSRGSAEWVARLPPNVAYCIVCAYAVFLTSMIDEHRCSESHKKLLEEMGIQFDENGIPTAPGVASDGDADNVQPHSVDPIVAADKLFDLIVAPHGTMSSGDSFNNLPATDHSRTCLDASNSILSSGKAFNSYHMSGSSPHAIQQYTVKQRNQASESTNFANTDEPMETNISKDDCIVISSDSTIGTSSLKRKRDENDLALSRSSVSDSAVIEDRKMHEIGARHQANIVSIKPSGSIADSSTTLLSRTMPDSSESSREAFHCSVCNVNVLYSKDNLSSDTQDLERLQHSTLHEYGFSPQDFISCTLCNCVLTGKSFFDHNNGQKHKRKFNAKKMIGEESGTFILFRPDPPHKASVTLSIVPKAVSTSSTVSKVSLELEFRELSEHKRHVSDTGLKGNERGIYIPDPNAPPEAFGTIPASDKSNDSIPDSSNALVSSPRPGSSDNCHPAFHCTVCGLDLLYANDHLSSYNQDREQQKHRFLHEFHLPSLNLLVLCTLCKCALIGTRILPHRNGLKHQQAVSEMGLEGNECGIFIPDPHMPPQALGIIPITAKSSGSILGSSVNRPLGFHCTVCEFDVFYCSDHLSERQRNLERLEHIRLHENGIPSGQHWLTCTLCECQIRIIHVLDHKNGLKHQQKVSEMGMKANESDVFIPYLFHPDED